MNGADRRPNKKKRADLDPLGSSLQRVLERLGAGDPGALERLTNGWDEALGPAAPHARLVAYREGELVVEADHPAWATRVQMAKGRLESLAGESLRLEVRIRR